MKKTKTKIGILLMLLMAIFALAIYAEEQDTLDKAKFQAAVPYNKAL